MLKTFCFCSFRQLQPERKAGLLEEDEMAAGLGFLMSPLTSSERLLQQTETQGMHKTSSIYDYRGTRNSSVSIRGIQGTSTALGLAAGFSAPCTGSKNILPCSFWPRKDTTPK